MRGERRRSPAMQHYALAVMEQAERDFRNWGLAIPLPTDGLLDRFNAVCATMDLPEECAEVTLPGSAETPSFIGIREADPESRRRFSLAHGLGHLRLHAGRKCQGVGLRRRFEDYRLETEANAYAAALQMPTEHFIAAQPNWLETPWDAVLVVDLDEAWDHLRHIGDQFGVSRAAVFYRLKDTGLLVTDRTFADHLDALEERRVTRQSQGLGCEQARRRCTCRRP